MRQERTKRSFALCAAAEAAAAQSRPVASEAVLARAQTSEPGKTSPRAAHTRGDRFSSKSSFTQGCSPACAHGS